MAGLFVAAGQDGLRVVSSDGRNWEHAQLGKEGETYHAVAAGGGTCVATGNYGGDNIFSQTRDGKEWAFQKAEAKYVNFVRGLSFGDGKYLGLGGDPGSVGGSRPFVMLSADGKTWPEPQFISGKHILRRAVWGEGRWVAVGDRGRRATSKDALAWEDDPQAKSTDSMIDVACGAGVFVGVGLHGLRMTTRDGLKWENRVVGEEGEHLNSVVWAGDRFVAPGVGATYESADGFQWKRTPNENAPQTICFGAGVFVGVKWKGRLLRSTDAIKWEEVYRAERHVGAIGFAELA